MILFILRSYLLNHFSILSTLVYVIYISIYFDMRVIFIIQKLYLTIEFSVLCFSWGYLIITFSFSLFLIAKNRRLIWFRYYNILSKFWWNLTKFTACLIVIVISWFLIKFINPIIKNLNFILLIELSLKIKFSFTAYSFFTSWVSRSMQHSWKFTKFLKSKFIINSRRFI